MKAVYYIFASTPGVVRILLELRFFEKISFFSFFGAPENILWPHKPYLALETPTLEGSYF